MKTQTVSQRSRKAPQGRAGEASITSISSSDGSATPSGKRYALIKLGVDTHGGQHTFARMIDHLGSQPPQRLSPDQFIEFLKKQLALADRVVMVYEAGPYGFSLYRQVTALGVECLVCAPERLSRGRKRVNDKIDAKELLNRLDCHLAGNNAVLRLVAVPTIQQELSRRQARERNTYRKDRQRWMARGRSLLHTMGIPRPGRWWQPARYEELMDILQARYGQEVRDPVQSELEGYRQMLQTVDKKLGELTALLRKASLEKKQPRVRGLGPLSSELLDREMGDWSRFKNRRQVASYTGLCPGEESSGDSRMSLSIDKHGNPRVRAVLVESAWLLPRYQPDYRPLAKWKWAFEKGSKAPAALRKKAAVALGRRLAVDLWRIRTGRATPQELGLQLKT
jgi:transposase